MTRRRVLLVAAATPVVGVLVALATNALSAERRWPGGLDFVRTHAVLSLLISLLVAVALAGLAVMVPSQKHPADLHAIVDLLADAVRVEWDAEARWRRVFDPYPLTMRWVPTDRDLVMSWPAVLELAAAIPSNHSAMSSGLAAGPPSLAGSGSLAKVLDRVPTRRLVVLGGPGAGKTILLVRLVLDLLERRKRGEPVPMLLPLASWNPVDEDLDAWVVRWLTTGRSALSRLAHDGSRSSLAKALLDQGLILLVLDGLDEIPSAVRGSAIDRINLAMRAGQSLVLASRTNEYRSAVRPAPGEEVRLTGALGIELCAIDPERVGEYLKDSAGGPEGAARWDPVVGTFTEDPQPTIAKVLTTPLMAMLARTIYNPRPREKLSAIPHKPAELLDRKRFATREEIAGYLFDCYIPACYREHADPYHPSRRYRWTASQAQRWLVFLARQLDGQKATDLEWWKLPRMAPWHFVALVFSVAVAIVGGIGYEFVGFGVGLTVSLATGFTVRKLVHVSGGRTSLTRGLVGGLTGGAIGGAIAASVLGPGPRDYILGSVLVAGLAMGLAVASMGTFAAGACGGLVGTLAVAFYEHAAAFQAIRMTVGAGSHIINGFGIGLAALFIIELAARETPAKGPRWSPVWSVCGILCGLVIGFAVWAQGGQGPGLAAGLATIVAGGLTGVVGQAAATDLAEAPDPSSVLRRDRATFITSSLGLGFAVAISTGLPGAVSPSISGHPNGLRYGLTLGITNLLVIGIGFGFVQALWGRYMVARCWLAASGRIPWRFMAFLRDAHENHGVLRQVGAIYQFRHVELQRHLAAQPKE